ncbi:uncharacterized protein TRIVIDRAFT_224951 [Trichoderma virens Gv29-8]|uniref:Uncharacterized protein n=1 Tax=Hypocrea virens (strain Gv29-8 / FGSC 10586) TaxID=413071 RepID=G9N1W3_HYPVG|nr:uncharacterized protein TRIVIDRAFT_224951 [Trichoderma virens Gv29-8]EHK19080.1 hypothetical protein TRIVIDRAFT_224951 [Trichoderma virens Gv29-8]UKZ49468.1 hypothetical protein TrVGV298_003715 [Trichoderma virens]
MPRNRDFFDSEIRAPHWWTPDLTPTFALRAAAITRTWFGIGQGSTAPAAPGGIGGQERYLRWWWQLAADGGTTAIKEYRLVPLAHHHQWAGEAIPRTGDVKYKAYTRALRRRPPRRREHKELQPCTPDVQK